MDIAKVLQFGWPEAEFSVGEDYKSLVWLSTSAKPSKKAIEDKAIEYEEYKVLTQYKQLRKYPPIPEQLDMLYWDTINGGKVWQNAITAIKEAHPKPDQE